MGYTTIDFDSFIYPVTVEYSYTNTMFGETFTLSTSFDTADAFKNFCTNFEATHFNSSNLQILTIENSPEESLPPTESESETIPETETATGELEGMIEIATNGFNDIALDTGLIVTLALPCALVIFGLIFVVRKSIIFFKGLSK